MSELPVVSEKTFRYPVLYRMVAWLGVLLFGLILLGSVLVVVEAIKNNRNEAMLYVFGFIAGALLLPVGLDFATRSIAVTPDGLRVRWLLRRSFIPWPDVQSWNYLPLSLIHLRFRHGRGVYVWPILEDYFDLLSTIDAQRFASLTK